MGDSLFISVSLISIGCIAPLTPIRIKLAMKNDSWKYDSLNLIADCCAAEAAPKVEVWA